MESTPSVIRFTGRGRIRSVPASRLLAAYIEYIRPHPWDHFVVLTLRRNWGDERLRREITRWLRRIASRQPQGQRGYIDYFWVAEIGRRGGRRHVHILTHNTAHVSAPVLKALWLAGSAHVENFDSQRGGAAYVAKWLLSDMVDYDFSRRPLPAERSRRAQGRAAAARRQATKRRVSVGE